LGVKLTYGGRHGNDVNDPWQKCAIPRIRTRVVAAVLAVDAPLSSGAFPTFASCNAVP
jgi:hypothetical protein